MKRRERKEGRKRKGGIKNEGRKGGKKERRKEGGKGGREGRKKERAWTNCRVNNYLLGFQLDLQCY